MRVALALAQCAFLCFDAQAQPARAGTGDAGTNARPDAVEDRDPLEEGWFRRFLMRSGSREESGGLFEFYGFRPVTGGLWTGAGTTAGILFEPLSEESRVYVSAAGRASLRGYWGSEGLFGLESNPLVVYGYARYQHRPQEDFYGIGPNTPRSDHAIYRQDELIAGGLVGTHAGNNLFLGGHVSMLENRIGPGTGGGKPSVDETFVATDAPGMHPGVSYVVSGAWIEYDTRDLPPLRAFGSRFSPSQPRLRGLSLDARRGFHASAELRQYVDLDGGQYGFSRVILESQQYIPFRHGDHVFALREFGSFSRPARDEVVPIYMMQPLGGVRSLRGFDNFRFRDLNVILVNAEYRWQLWRPLQLAVFADAGHVFRRFDQVSTEDLEVSYGIGLRTLFGGRVFIRLEFARSREGMTTYVKVGSFL